MDCYTTKVEMHSAYVEAEYTDGTTSKTDTIKFGVSKKGLGLATDMGRTVDLKTWAVVGTIIGAIAQVQVHSIKVLSLCQCYGKKLTENN